MFTGQWPGLSEVERRGHEISGPSAIWVTPLSQFCLSQVATLLAHKLRSSKTGNTANLSRSPVFRWLAGTVLLGAVHEPAVLGRLQAGWFAELRVAGSPQPGRGRFPAPSPAGK